jgi:hypothetical protein
MTPIGAQFAPQLKDNASRESAKVQPWVHPHDELARADASPYGNGVGYPHARYGGTFDVSTCSTCDDPHDIERPSPLVDFVCEITGTNFGH